MNRQMAMMTSKEATTAQRTAPEMYPMFEKMNTSLYWISSMKVHRYLIGDNIKTHIRIIWLSEIEKRGIMVNRVQMW